MVQTRDQTRDQARDQQPYHVRPFVFIKSYYPPCKNFNARARARGPSLTFLNRHCARNAFFFFHLARQRGAQLPGMTPRIGCFDGITYLHEITISPFLRQRPIFRSAGSPRLFVHDETERNELSSQRWKFVRRL